MAATAILILPITSRWSHHRKKEVRKKNASRSFGCENDMAGTGGCAEFDDLIICAIIHVYYKKRRRRLEIGD